MRILLDTYVMLWCVSADGRLDRSAAALIRDPDNEVFFSAASVWELAIKRALGKIRVDLGALMRTLHEDGFSELPVLARHAAEVAALPRHHGDPFDHLLVAQSRVESLQLFTSDKMLARYGDHIVLLGQKQHRSSP